MICLVNTWPTTAAATTTAATTTAHCFVFSILRKEKKDELEKAGEIWTFDWSVRAAHLHDPVIVLQRFTVARVSAVAYVDSLSLCSSVLFWSLNALHRAALLMTRGLLWASRERKKEEKHFLFLKLDTKQQQQRENERTKDGYLRNMCISAVCVCVLRFTPSLSDSTRSRIII